MDYDHKKSLAVIFYTILTWYAAPRVAKEVGVDNEIVGITAGFLVSLALFQHYIQNQP